MQIYNPFRKVVANGTSINHSIAESIFSSGFSASNSYMEYWPNTTDDANPRRGIKLVRYDEESKTLKGVGGVKAIVAGIAVKKYKETKIQPFYFSYKGERK